ncbi:MAG TPA: c-type cytochrome [Drouetiella sp.]
MKNAICSEFLLVSACFLLTSAIFAPDGFAQPTSDTVKSDEKSLRLVKIPTSNYEPAKSSADSERGRILFHNFGCISCHSVHNVGGDLAPMLDGIGARRDDAFMISHLSKAQDAVAQYQQIRGANYVSTLPHSRYAPETAALLIAYLKTLPEPAGGFVVEPHVPRIPEQSLLPTPRNFKPEKSSASSEEGRKSFDKFGCIACHEIGNIGGALAPHLDGVGYRHTREFIQAHITDAQAHASALSTRSEKVSAKMPRFKISSEEAKQLTDYLLTLPDLSHK